MTSSHDEKAACSSGAGECGETPGVASNGIPSPDAQAGAGRYLLVGYLFNLVV